jgi:hypothetical protein
VSRYAAVAWPAPLILGSNPAIFPLKPGFSRSAVVRSSWGFT